MLILQRKAGYGVRFFFEGKSVLKRITEGEPWKGKGLRR
jgi:hypothetical protein